MALQMKVEMHRLIEKHDMLLFMGEQVPTLLVEATNETLDQVAELAADNITAEVNAPREEIARRVGVSRAQRTSRIQVEGAVYLRSRSIPLRRFGPKQSRKGVVWRPYRSGSGRLLRRAFGPEIPRLGRGVFRRKSRRRTPIKRVPGMNLREDRVAISALQSAESQANALLQANADRRVRSMLDAATRGQKQYGLTYVSRDDTRATGTSRISL